MNPFTCIDSQNKPKTEIQKIDVMVVWTIVQLMIS